MQIFQDRLWWNPWSRLRHQEFSSPGLRCHTGTQLEPPLSPQSFSSSQLPADGPQGLQQGESSSQPRASSSDGTCGTQSFQNLAFQGSRPPHPWQKGRRPLPTTAKEPAGVHSPGIRRGEASAQEIIHTKKESDWELKIPKYYRRIPEGLGGKGP